MGGINEIRSHCQSVCQVRAESDSDCLRKQGKNPDRHGFGGNIVAVGLREVTSCRRRSRNSFWLNHLNAPILSQYSFVQ